MGRILGSGGNKAAGLAAAIEGLDAGAAPADPAPSEQLPLLPSAELDALPIGDGRVEALRRRGPGRPKGAINRSTQEWRDYLLHRFTSPLVFLGELYSRRTLDLANELGCKPIEAAAIQERAAGKMAEFVHAKMPVEVALQGSVPVFMMVDPEEWLARQAEQAGEGPALAEMRPVIEIQSDQGVIDGAAVRVEQPQSNSTGNVQSDQSVSADPSMIADHGTDGAEGER